MTPYCQCDERASRGVTSVCSWTKLPKHGNSFPIYRLKWHRQILPSVIDGCIIKPSKCSKFELLVTILAFGFRSNIPSLVTVATVKSCFCHVTIQCYNLSYNHQHILLSILHFLMPTHFGSTLIRHVLLIGLSFWNFLKSTSSFSHQYSILLMSINFPTLWLILSPTHFYPYLTLSTLINFLTLWIILAPKKWK